ncbi:hypothetical protein HY625_00465 [Candidatus Uhrbacteria bacterium]|nr:hypothetical protein [Candidatus Uhrbacteria bacterium]
MKIVIHYTKKSAAVASAMVLLIIGGVVVLSMRNNESAASPRIVSSPASIPSQQIDEGPVDVTVEHDAKQSTTTTHVFTVVLNTHSGDLSTFDGQANIIYRPTSGNETRPVAIGGDREGHHRTVVVTFNNTALPGTLAVKNLRGVPERTFPITP